MPLSQQGIEYLLAEKAAILAAPHNLVMQAVLAVRGESCFKEVRTPENNLCGTAHCIAGGIVQRVDGINLVELWDRYESNISGESSFTDIVLDRAGVLIGDLHSPLFFVSYWPHDLQTRYDNAETDVERAQAAADAIDRYIADLSSFYNY